MPIVRPSRDSDIPAITAIYAREVLHGTGTFELEPPLAAEMASRRADVLANGLPYLVLQRGEDIVGFAYCTRFRPRPAYRFSAENSIYLAPQAQGAGLGRVLMAELLVRAQSAGVRKLIAVIGDSRNAASIGVHRTAGFSDVGVLKSCGWKFGQWLDVVLMERALGLGDSTGPDPGP